ncbi:MULTISPECIES: DUF3995 domain-containing protein [Streptomyces]|uniref:DUF3995 domain-containing protein n=1 Tax=Streptomyces TaxID=1883 RepID=UPI0021B04544|nr:MULTISPECIES: DUF3995 domain-containing protein [Streptomyces]GLX19755.1 hypothetical protein Slala01_33990 [Streptomyces lavendulae subsp. lavendulae]GLX27250.1 hypothetical protein Slala02_30700 [Streptomyces lavendulae subsp. lavendulae]
MKTTETTKTATRTATKRATKTATTTAVRQAWAGYVAAGAALAYAAPHFWWGAGVGATFPGDFASAPHGTWEAAIGYWVMGAVAVAGAVVALALVRPWGRRLPRRTLCALSLTASAGMTLWGFTYFAMQGLLAAGRVVSAPAFAAKDAHPQAAWGLFWYGLFVLWGLMLGRAAWTRLRGGENHGALSR